MRTRQLFNDNWHFSKKGSEPESVQLPHTWNALDGTDGGNDYWRGTGIYACDQYGLIVWAEIPYITEPLKSGRENALSQMRELIVQNYNHPSIVCWGLSNEITANSGVTDEIIETHKALNALYHALDQTRPTYLCSARMIPSLCCRTFAVITSAREAGRILWRCCEKCPDAAGNAGDDG